MTDTFLGTLFIVSAPSGAGKTTVTEAALKVLQVEHKIEKIITYTTRSVRPGEVEGHDYHFVTVQDFTAKMESGFFFETSTWYEAYYGLPNSFIEKLRAGISCVLILDRFGARSIKAQFPDAVLIWLEPASLEVLKSRLIARGGMAEEQVNKRLEKAAVEMSEEMKENFYNFHIINNNFVTTVNLVVKTMAGAIAKKQA